MPRQHEQGCSASPVLPDRLPARLASPLPPRHLQLAEACACHQLLLTFTQCPGADRLPIINTLLCSHSPAGTE